MQERADCCSGYYLSESGSRVLQRSAQGNRLSVAELSGRTVNYGYDDLYRLTSENTVCGTGTPV